MAYTMTIAAILGAGKTGLAAVLRAQPVDTNGTAVDAAQAGFIERGTSGSYMVTLTMPSGHRGGIDVYSTTAPTVILTFLAVNPEEFENQIRLTVGPGLEHTLPESRMRHVVPPVPLHHALPAGQLHHAVPEEDF